MSEVKRKRGETFEGLLRRFNRRMLLSGKILQARKIRFFKSPETREDRRGATLRKKRLTAKYEYMKKTGRLREEEKPKRPARA